jgi:hypothetical protein
MKIYPEYSIIYCERLINLKKFLILDESIILTFCQ